MARRHWKEADVRQAGFDPLAERLRREATESRPVFSETLHRRIVEAIGAGRRSQSQATVRQRGAARRRHAFGVFVTAACLLLAVAVGWRVYEGRVAAARKAAIERYVDELASQVASRWVLSDLLADRGASAGFDQLMGSAGLSPRSGPLADNARAAANSLLRRLPIDVGLAQSSTQPPEDRFAQ
ncbi:MAG: hypothetical protein LLG00_13565 [Planctomycetaceae bacterium]|nr:hypothetical protein [Planctomycetaceae bacterium]